MGPQQDRHIKESHIAPSFPATQRNCRVAGKTSLERGNTFWGKACFESIKLMKKEASSLQAPRAQAWDTGKGRVGRYFHGVSTGRWRWRKRGLILKREGCGELETIPKQNLAWRRGIKERVAKVDPP